jgi:hypothetical protein
MWMPTKARETLSQFIARVLSQLSLAAWLPSVVLVGSLYVVFEARRPALDRTTTFPELLASVRLSTLALMAAAVIAFTLLTQAFAFGAIRMLEGYWFRPDSKFGIRLLRRSEGRIRQLQSAETEALAEAKQKAIRRMRNDSTLDQRIVSVLDGLLFGYATSATVDELSKASRLVWADYLDPTDHRKLERIRSDIRDYPPRPARALPTRIGNIIRGAEDRARPKSPDPLSGWIIDVFNELPEAMREQHDEHRTRLDLYASLIPVFILVQTLSMALLWSYWSRMALALGISFILMLVSYAGAIAGARGYAQTLLAIGKWTSGREESRSSQSEPSPDDTAGPRVAPEPSPDAKLRD